MPLNFESKREVVSTSKSYRDLRHIADDKTVLENPHKGWYYHFVDNGLKDGRYRDRVECGARFITGGMHHVYIRFDWGDVQPDSEDKIDWSEIDAIMEERGALGYKFSLRICTFESGEIVYATPKWVFDAGAGYTEVGADGQDLGDGRRCTAYEPDYGDPIFLEKLDAFLGKCAEKFDNDPRVEYIDVGTFGTWGEGHTGMGSNKVFSPEVLKKHINLHLKHFKNKTIVLNDDFIEHAWKTSPEASSELYDYCLGKGLGLRDDSICVDGYVKLFGYDTMRFPSIFEHFAKNAPVDIELAHVWHQTEERFKGGFPVIEALRTAHATYAGFHGYEDKWHDKCPYISDYIANRLGYWYFIDGVDLGTPSSGAREVARVYIRNKGYSKCYHQYDLRLRLADGKGNYYALNSSFPDSRSWEAESLSEETLLLDYRNVPSGNYTLELGLFDGDRAVKLAISSERICEGGYYSLCDVFVGEL